MFHIFDCLSHVYVRILIFLQHIDPFPNHYILNNNVITKDELRITIIIIIKDIPIDYNIL